MTECSMCGDCCENIALNVDLGTLVNSTASGQVNKSQPLGGWYRDAAFIRANFIPTGEVRREGKRVKQVLKCLKFDTETRTCTAHNERPSLCRRYPWYDEDPKKGDTTMGGRCSFLADTYSMLPIVSINGKTT